MAKIKVEAFKQGEAELFISPGAVRSLLKQALRLAALRRRDDYQKTVSTWKNKPQVFTRQLSDSEIETGIDDQRWLWLDGGTKDHFVAPVNAKALAFQSDYTTKSTPGIIGAKNGGPSGPMRFSKGHMVSGIKPRKWSAAIELKHETDLEKLVDAAIDRIFK